MHPSIGRQWHKNIECVFPILSALFFTWVGIFFRPSFKVKLVFNFCWRCVIWITHICLTSSLWDDVITAVYRVRNKKCFPPKIRGTEKNHQLFMLAEILTQKLWTCNRCYLLCVNINTRQERLLRDFSFRAGILSPSPHCPVFPPCLRYFKQKFSSVLKWMSCASGLLKFSCVHIKSRKFLFYEVGPTEVLWQDELNSKIFFGSSLHMTVFYCNGLTGFWYIFLSSTAWETDVQ